MLPFTEISLFKIVNLFTYKLPFKETSLFTNNLFLANKSPEAVRILVIVTFPFNKLSLFAVNLLFTNKSELKDASLLINNRFPTNTSELLIVLALTYKFPLNETSPMVKRFLLNDRLPFMEESPSNINLSPPIDKFPFKDRSFNIFTLLFICTKLLKIATFAA